MQAVHQCGAEGRAEDPEREKISVFFEIECAEQVFHP
jgi:hypothetical protein